MGDYTIVHVGFAISKIDEVAALDSIKTFKDRGLFDEEFGVELAPLTDRNGPSH